MKKIIIRLIGIIILFLIIISMFSYLLSSQYIYYWIGKHMWDFLDIEPIKNFRDFYNNLLTFIMLVKWITFFVSALYIFFLRLQRSIIFGIIGLIFVFLSLLFQFIIGPSIFSTSFSLDLFKSPSYSIEVYGILFPVTFSSFYIISIIKLVSFIILYALLIIIKWKSKFEESSRLFLMDKIERIFAIADKVRLDMLQEILNLGDEAFNDRVVKIAQDFGVEIDDKYIIINRDTLDDFMVSLDTSFKEWESLVEKKVKKA